MGKKLIDPLELSYNKPLFLAGCISGGPQLLVCTPIELVKVRAQKNNLSNFNYTKEI